MSLEILDGRVVRFVTAMRSYDNCYYALSAWQQSISRETFNNAGYKESLPAETTKLY